MITAEEAYNETLKNNDVDIAMDIVWSTIRRAAASGKFSCIIELSARFEDCIREIVSQLESAGYTILDVSSADCSTDIFEYTSNWVYWIQVDWNKLND